MRAAQRRWLEISVRSPSAGELAPLLADALVSLGGRASEERAGWFVTFVAEPDDLDAFVAQVRVQLADASGLEDIELRTAWQPHEEWAETWKRGLAPRRVTDRIVVTPSWEEPQTDSGDVVIVVDPGMAFGTAEHGTTRGCLRLLDQTLELGDLVLDVGSGSGILAIAAALLGADHVSAVEGDDLACEALVENVQRNGVADRVTVESSWATPSALAARDPASGIVANIETGILRPLFPSFAAALRPGGWLIVSGVLGGEWSEVRRALEAEGFTFEAIDEDGEWRSGLFRRRA